MEQFLIQNTWIIFIIIIWTIPWKAIALWKSARQDQKWWFLAFLFINTVGLLEILYIFIFSKNKDLIKK